MHSSERAAVVANPVVLDVKPGFSAGSSRGVTVGGTRGSIASTWQGPAGVEEVRGVQGENGGIPDAAEAAEVHDRRVEQQGVRGEHWGNDDAAASGSDGEAQLHVLSSSAPAASAGAGEEGTMATCSTASGLAGRAAAEEQKRNIAKLQGADADQEQVEGVGASTLDDMRADLVAPAGHGAAGPGTKDVAVTGEEVQPGVVRFPLVARSDRK